MQVPAADNFTTSHNHAATAQEVATADTIYVETGQNYQDYGEQVALEDSEEVLQIDPSHEQHLLDPSPIPTISLPTDPPPQPFVTDFDIPFDDFWEFDPIHALNGASENPSLPPDTKPYDQLLTLNPMIGAPFPTPYPSPFLYPHNIISNQPICFNSSSNDILHPEEPFESLLSDARLAHLEDLNL